MSGGRAGWRPAGRTRRSGNATSTAGGKPATDPPTSATCTTPFPGGPADAPTSTTSYYSAATTTDSSTKDANHYDSANPNQYSGSDQQIHPVAATTSCAMSMTGRPSV